MEDSSHTNINPNENDAVQSQIIPQEPSKLAKADGTASTEVVLKDKVIHINTINHQLDSAANYPIAITLFNKTNKRLHLQHKQEEIVLPALGAMTIALEEIPSKESSFRNYDFIAKVAKLLLLRGWLSINVKWSDEGKAQTFLAKLLGLLSYGLFFFAVAFAIQLVFPVLANIAWAAAIILMGLILIGSIELPDGKQPQMKEDEQFSSKPVGKSPFTALFEIWQNSIQWSSLVITIAIGILIPAFVISVYGGPLVCNSNRGAFCLAAFGRELQFLFIAFAGILPGLLYFLFDRQRLSVLRKEVERNIFRLDPSVETTDDIQANYGEKIEALYGSSHDKSSRVAGGTRTPIIVATALLTVGMIMTILPLGKLEIAAPFDLYALLLPRQTTFSMGFAGAYFFTMVTIIRRYSLGDLTAKTYTHVSVRIITVIVLAWVLDILVTLSANSSSDIESISAGIRDTGRITLIIAFIVGIVPDTFWTLLREIAQKIPYLGTMVTSLKTDELPLTSIAGVDIYERSRLYEEGISNLQGLVHYDLISLMLNSRIPSARIVDWVDQAILEIHLAQLGNQQGAFREYIKNRGIRNTSDFVRLHEDALSSEEPAIAQIYADIYKILQDDEWYLQIRYWRENPKIKDVTINVDENANLMFSEV